MSSDRWRVDPAAASSVTKAARAAAHDVDDSLRKISGATHEGTLALGPTASARALGALEDGLFRIEVQATASTIDDAAQRVDDSVRIFEDGDEQMRDDIERARIGAMARRPAAG